METGLGTTVGQRAKRTLNPDGSFNIRRINGPRTVRDVYLRAVTLPWWKFITSIVVVFAVLNSLFALAYWSIGIDQLRGTDPATTGWHSFIQAFYFSTQSLTTVGFGGIHPQVGPAALLAAIEAVCGVLIFAVISSLMYGRFARPSARIAFSRTALIHPGPEGQDVLLFRIVNQRSTQMMELDARVLLMTWETGPKGDRREYDDVVLEYHKIYFFPLNWTVTHRIGPDSPLWNQTPETLRAAGAELLILIKGWDETFSQWVHASYSYRADEIEWNKRYRIMYHNNPDGETVLDLEKLSDTEPV